MIFAATWSVAAAALPIETVKGGAGLAATPIFAMRDDNRLNAEELALAHKTALPEIRASHLASGLVECGDSHGAGQLTLTKDTIVTEADGQWLRTPIDMASMVVGSPHPYAVSTVNDWAVERLSRPLAGAEPYGLASKVALNDRVAFAARGHSNWRDQREMSFEDSRLRAKINESVDGRREFAFDCSTGDGASGGAVLFDEDRRQLGAILVGWRRATPTPTTTKPQPFSLSYYNFVITIEGAFRRALLRVANRGGEALLGRTR